MAAAMNISGRVAYDPASFKPILPGLADSGRGSSKLNLNSHGKRKENARMARYGTRFNRLEPMKKFVCTRQLVLANCSPEDLEIEMEQHPAAPTKMIREFYLCINEKKLRQLDQYVTDDCYLEECSFPFAMEGKEVRQFFHQLSTSMGQNVKFRIEHVCQDEELTVGVNWHLEWKETPIPFTRGCSFYECLLKENRLLIKKARVVTESPIKPGIIVLNLLKTVISIFDDFPKAAEWFLKSPHVIVQFLMVIYARLLAPIINPLLAGYFKMWNFVARLFALALNTLLYILKNYLG